MPLSRQCDLAARASSPLHSASGMSSVFNRTWSIAVFLLIAFLSGGAWLLVTRDAPIESDATAVGAAISGGEGETAEMGSAGDQFDSRTTPTIPATVVADILVEAAAPSYWPVELRGRISRLPLRQQAEIVTHPALQGRKDASQWADRLLLSCGQFLLAASGPDRPSRDKSYEWQQAWCADLGENPEGWRDKLTEATSTYREAMRETDPWAALDNLQPREAVVTELTRMLRSDDIEVAVMGVRQLLFMRASDGTGVGDLPRYMMNSLEESSRSGASAAALIACQAEGYCGWRSPWIGEYCAIFAAECVSGASLEAQISRNESEVRIAALRQWTAALLRIRNGP